jgi:DNA-binding GntR family transcriptional regulator
MNDESRKGYLDRMKTMQKEHRAIISALSSKDGEKAINAISDHVNKAADHIENNSNFY